MATRNDELVELAIRWFNLGQKERQIAIQLCLQRGLIEFTDNFKLKEKR